MNDEADKRWRQIKTEKIAESWKVLELGELVEVKGGKRLPKGESLIDEITDFPYIRISDFKNGSVDLVGIKYLLPETQAKISRYTISNKDVYISIAGTIGIIGIIPTELDGANLTENSAKLVIKDSKLNKDYLALCLINEHCQKQISSFTTKNAQPKLALTRIEKILITVPQIEEQKAIAKVLRSVEKAKEAQQTELRLERERKNALMNYLFTSGIRGESLKQTEIGEMPASWEVVRLGEMITLQRGKDLPIQDRVKGDIPIVGSNGIVGFHNQTANMPIPCVATGRSGSIGLITYVDKPYWALNTALYVSDYKGNYPLFIYYWLHLFDFKRYAEGASVPTLNRNKVHPVKFRLPTIEEQKEIAEVLQACDEKILALENEIKLFDEFFKAMLEELIGGKISTRNLME